VTVVLELDVHDPDSRRWRGKPFLCDWIRALGADPGTVFALRVLADGDGVVEFDRYATSNGRRYRDPRTDDAARAPMLVVPLTVPVPVELLTLRGRP
jgi:hypothetical protein